MHERQLYRKPNPTRGRNARKKSIITDNGIRGFRLGGSVGRAPVRTAGYPGSNPGPDENLLSLISIYDLQMYNLKIKFSYWITTYPEMLICPHASMTSYFHLLTAKPTSLQAFNIVFDKAHNKYKLLHCDIVKESFGVKDS